ncbi:MAG TPA: hypothetical protein VLG76_07845 [Rhabdochlamydiaceae bacterium]|nr:hypothetical protein [Rhabdochlamydiaceae bacterium]
MLKFLLIFMLSFSTLSFASDLEQCLEQIYMLDPPIAQQIRQKLEPIKELSIIQDFISLSKQITFSKQTTDLNQFDAVLVAPDEHKLLFENDQLRILESFVPVGGGVPFHTHQWDSIMIIIQGSRFQVETSSGEIKEEIWGTSVERFPGSLESDIYTNLGPEEFLAIAFEIKK